MVLEKLMSIKMAIRQPVWVFILGGIISVICTLLAYVVFQTNIGWAANFLITFAMLPFMINLVTYEASMLEENMEKYETMNIFERHRSIIVIYIAFFAGMILTLSIFSMFLPDTLVQKIFENQINEIDWLRSKATFGGTFQSIILNNLGVLFAAFIFSVLFGAGALFILSWNASVLSTAISMAAKSLGGFKGLPEAILSYFPHGSLEILAFFVGAIAGGLVSVAITKRKTKEFWFIIKDSLEMLGAAVVLLILAAVIETTLIIY